MKITIKFEVDSIEEANEITSTVGGGELTRLELLNSEGQPSERPTNEPHITQKQPGGMSHTDPTFAAQQAQGATEPTTEAPPATTPAAKGGKITGKAVNDALKAYKQANGYPAYKKVLDYFGVTQVRLIKADNYQAVLDYIATPPAGDAPEMAQAPAETPTVDRMMASLRGHKERHGIQATEALITEMGFASANQIPVESFATMIQALDNYVAPEPTTEAGTGGAVDLSAFSL